MLRNTLAQSAEMGQKTVRFLKTCCLLLLIGKPIQAQQTAIGLHYQLGSNLPIHPNYPDVRPATHAFELSILRKTSNRYYWTRLYKRPTIVYSLGYQSLGNAAILGHAFYAIPQLEFDILQHKKLSWRWRLGWGFGLVTKTYNSFNNPQNIVMGAHLNACATLQTHLHYELNKRWILQLGLGINHYSNGGFVTPNLGINIPFAQVGVQYIFQTKLDSNTTPLTDKVLLNRRYRPITPFITIGLGMTESVATRGPKYPVYLISLGAARRMAEISKLSLSVEYSYHTASYAFDLNKRTTPPKHWDYARLSILATHEFIFGHWGFLTAAGVYLNDHRYRRSVIVTKIGFNAYLNNYFKRHRHQLWLGVHVRAYAGEAESVELVLGYNW